MQHSQSVIPVLVLKLTHRVGDVDVLALALPQFGLQVELVCQGHP